MILFQCSKCGCIEAKAFSNWSESKKFNDFYNDKHPKFYDALVSYKNILGLSDKDEFGIYCSACSPLWYTLEGGWGIGVNPNPTASRYTPGGLWHGDFERRYLPKGQFETDELGHLRHKETKDKDIRKYITLTEQE